MFQILLKSHQRRRFSLYNDLHKGTLVTDAATQTAGRRKTAENVIREMSPRGFPIYWLGAAGKPADAEEGTDFWATSHGYVSVTPLQVDLTNYKQVPTVKGWMESPIDLGKLEEAKEN